MMKRALTIFVLVLLASACGRRSDNEITYRGEKIKLSRSYSDYDEYKEDPNNIDKSETERVQRLMIQAPIAREFPTLLDASKAIQEIAFPGYGSGGFTQQRQKDGTVLHVFSVEIPRAGKDRWFTFRETNGRIRLIDDFVAPEVPAIGRVTEENGALVYSSSRGERILVRPLNQK